MRRHQKGLFRTCLLPVPTTYYSTIRPFMVGVAPIPRYAGPSSTLPQVRSLQTPDLPII